MPNRYAVIDTNVVENVVLAASAPTVPGRTIVQLAAGQTVSPGDGYDGAAFTPYIPTAAELAKRNAPANIGRLYQSARSRANTLNTLATGLAAPLTVAQTKTLLQWVADLYDYAADQILADGRDG